MTSEDRAALIDLLDRLGSADDASVLEAARALHRRVNDVGLSWDDLVRREDHAEADAATDAVAEPALPNPDAAETARLIERILRKDISETLRADLAEMKRQLADDGLDAEDRRYLRALAKRLGA